MDDPIICTASLSRQRPRVRRRDIIIEATTQAGLVCGRGERQCDGHARSRLPVNDALDALSRTEAKALRERYGVASSDDPKPP